MGRCNEIPACMDRGIICIGLLRQQCLAMMIRHVHELKIGMNELKMKKR
jgi:hypothetical protein